MKLATAFAFLLTLAAWCVNAEESKDAKQEKDQAANQGDGCVFSRNINDWQVIDNRTLAVWAPTRKTPYVLELSFPATGLKFEHSLGFEDRNGDGRLCAYGGDALVIGGAVAERIPIARLRRVDADEVKRLLAQAERPRDKSKATMPEQSDMKSDKDKSETSAKPEEPEKPRD